MRIALASRDVHPFVPGGIAPIMTALAELLAPVAEVTLLTADTHRAHPQALDLPGVEVVWVPEPPHEGPFPPRQRRWSERLRDAVAELKPDLVEFPDYLAEGWATAESPPRGTTVAVRLHTTDEMIASLNRLRFDEMRPLYAMERACLRRAGRLLWPGGDVLASYERFYGADALAPATRVPDAFLVEGDPLPSPSRAGEPLALLYLGRLERRKGVDTLVRAAARVGSEPPWTLTLLGADTPTAPGGGSMREHVEQLRPPWVHLHDPVPRAQVGELIARHDAVVMPSVWECWPNTVREAYLHGKPVVATPVGGHVEMVRPGVSGWLCRDNGEDAVAETLAALVADPEAVRALAAAGGPGRTLAELNDPDRMRERYLELARGRR